MNTELSYLSVDREHAERLGSHGGEWWCVCGEEGEGCPPADNPATGNEGLEFVWKTISLLNMDYKMVSWWIYGK